MCAERSTERSSGNSIDRALGFVVLAILVIPFRVAVAMCPVEAWSIDQVTSLARAEMGADGIGGSGYTAVVGGDEDGIGGSGIFGTITGFGSLCVNGRRVLYEDSVVVSVDASVTDLSELVVGQVVRVETVIREDGIHARSIDIQHELQGPVTAIGADVLEVMGERVELAGALAAFEGEIKVGTRIALSGLRQPDDKLVVSRIDLAPSNEYDLVRGTAVFGDAANDPRMGAVSLRVSTVDLGMGWDADQGRARQLVRGWWNSTIQKLEVVRAEPSPVVGRRDRRIDVEGYVTEASETGFRVAGLRFVSKSRPEGGDIGEGDRVRIRAVREGGDEDFRVLSGSIVPASRLLRALDRQWRVTRSQSGIPPRLNRTPRTPGRDRIRPDGLRRPERPVRPEPQRDRIRRRVDRNRVDRSPQ